MSNARSSSPQHGFTLLEVLVAVAILSLISLATLQLAGSGVDAARHVQGRTMAMIVAENALVDTLLDANAPRGKQSSLVTNIGQSWRVTQTIEPMPDPRVLRVEIEVEGEQPLARAALSSYKVVDPDA